MKKPFILIIILLFIGGCATQLKIETDSDKVYDLSSYSTFSIEAFDVIKEPSQISINPIFLQRVSRSIEQSLVKRGFKKSSEPDMVVRFFIATEREVERSQSYSSWYRRGYLDDRNQRYYRVDKDALTIRFHDAETDEVVWYAFSRFNRNKAPKEQEEVNVLIEQAISSFKTSL
jgi:mannosyltransferase OCH1-like enzyme|tara:strand:- start:2946 stop:3467 length:522 start_codon:yes stop_codon:yes gene_type:complete